MLQKKEKGIKPTFTGKGMKWCINGIIDKKIFEKDLPEGFYLGRTKYTKKKE